MKKLKKAKVQMLTSTMVIKIENHTVFLQKKEQEHDLIWNSKLENIDTIVLAVGVTSNNELANNLKEIAPIYMVGDCLKPRDGLEAIYEGSKVAREI
jgi:NADH dehydrogenase FAD-containing subunit